MPHIEISAEKLFSIGGFFVTNTLIMSWIVVILLIVIAQLISRNVRLIPRRLQNLAEFGIEKLLNFMEGMFHSRKKAEKYLPLIATIFILVLISNWMGILPGVGSIGFYETHGEHPKFIPIFRSAASDLNFTLAIAITAVIMVNIAGIVAVGMRSFVSRYITFKNPIAFFVGILELLGEFSRIVSFSFRLFGNIFAGEVLLVIVSFLAPYLIPVPFLGLELFVGFVQALVFAMLTLVFISIAIEQHG
ncbi:MAG: atpB [Candidatus Paceibacter sp.]|jgi:F-type H+-transporting ATPase subunit a|nr:atpB [Candidatus Paceibacter sp.]